MKKSSRAQAHQQYKLKSGKRVPGVTTITGVLNKPALVKWANNLGLEGIDSSKYVNELGDVGTLTHYRVECFFTKVEVDLQDYTPRQIEASDVAMLKFLDWYKNSGFDFIASELQLVSEKERYGGTIDLYGKLVSLDQGVPDKCVLIDLKTSGACYPEHYTQVAGGYAPLLRENGYPVDDVYILRIGRSEEEGFEFRRVPAQDLHEKRFKLCRDLYEINKRLGIW